MGSSLLLGAPLRTGAGPLGAQLLGAWDLSQSGQHHKEGDSELSHEPAVPRVTDFRTGKA